MEKMRDLQTLLAILDGQVLAPGYLSPSGNNTAHDTLRALVQARSPIVTPQAPISPPDLLNTPAWVGSLRGFNAIFLNGVNGQLDLSHGNQQPAYYFQLP
jgi:hypothetical protein